MTSWMRSRLGSLYHALFALLTWTRDTVAEELQNLNETASVLYNRVKERTECLWKWLKHILEKVAEEEAEEQQQ